MSLDTMMRPKVVNTYEIEALKKIVDPSLINVTSGIIITSRSFEDAPEIRRLLIGLGISSDIQVYYNPSVREHVSTKTSSEHKANIIKMLQNIGYEHGIHFDHIRDDILALKELLPEISCVLMN